MNLKVSGRVKGQYLKEKKLLYLYTGNKYLEKKISIASSKYLEMCPENTHQIPNTGELSD